MKDSVKSVVVITVICLVVALLLGVTNYFTAPVIKKGNEERTQATLSELIEDGKFQKMKTENLSGVPESVTAIYKETTGLGYVIEISTKGYDAGLVIMCAISPEGKIIKTATLSSNETPTIGGNKVVNNDSYTSKYLGKDVSNIDGVDTVSGATITSNAYKNALKDALDAFTAVSGKF